MQFEMEVAQPDDVQPERLHRGEILERRVERSRQTLAPGEVEVEVIDEGLVPGNRLERIAVCERERGLTRRFARLRTGVEVHAHLLDGSRRRVVEGEVLYVSRLLFALGHADADAERALGVLPIPHVAEVRVLLAREEEGVRRREGRERAATGLDDDQSVLRLHTRERRVDRAAE